MKTVLRRFAELTAVCAVLSALSAAAVVLGIIPDTGGFYRMVWLFLTAVFYYINIRRLKKALRRAASGGAYIFENTLAALAFAAFSLLVLSLCGTAAYTWIFGITRFATAFTPLGINAYTSIKLFHFITLLSVFIAPYCPKHIFGNKGSRHRHRHKKSAD